MMICPKCKEYKEGNFCQKCGARLVEKIICVGKYDDGSDCGELLEPSDNFCNKCGHDVLKNKADVGTTNTADVEADNNILNDSTNQTDVGTTRPTDVEADSNSLDASVAQENTSVTQNINEHNEGIEDFTEIKDDDEDFKMARENLAEEGSDSELDGEQFETTETSADADEEPSGMTYMNPKASKGPSYDKELIWVDFHALLSPDLKFDEREHHVCLQIFENDSAHLKLNQMEATKHFDNEDKCDAVFMIYRAVFPRKSVTQNNITYKYVLAKKQKSRNERFKTKTLLDGSKRILSIPPEYHQIDVWNQFDGFLYSKETPWHYIYRKGAEMLSSKETDADMSARMFGEIIADKMMDSIEETIASTRRMCHQLFKGLETVYCLGTKSDTITERKKMHKKLWEVFEKKLHVRLPSETNEQMERRISTLVSMLYLSKDYRIDLDENSKSLVCERFMLKENGGCIKEWILLESLSQQARTDLCDAFLDFALVVQFQMKNPRLFYLVPFVHFLSGQSTPFERIPKDAGHDSEKPLWWGIKLEKMNAAIKGFKQKEGYSWSSCTLQEFSAHVEPLFSVDYLLPRTIVAAFNARELKDAIETNLYPAEVCCAAVYYYMKTQGGRNEEILVKCLNGILKLLKDTQTGESVQRWLKATISSQLLAESTRSENKNVVYLSAKIFGLSMSVYHLALHKDEHMEQNENIQCTHEASGNVIKWLRHGHLSTEKETSVATWELFFMKGDDEIEKVWNSNLRVALEETLQKMIDAGKHNEIVTLYCKQYANTKSEIQTLICDAVQMAVQSLDDINTSGWSWEEERNLIHLLSKMFSTQWDALIDPDTEMNIMMFVNWPSLPMYLKKIYKGFPEVNQSSHEDRFKTINTIVHQTCERLRKGTIRVGELKYLSKHKLCFSDIARLVECPHQDITEVIDIRMSEFNQYCSQLENLEFLKTCCQKLKGVNIEPINEILSKQPDSCTLDTLVIVTDEGALGTGSNTDRVEIVSEVFALRRLLDWISDYRNNPCFCRWWDEECTKHTDDDSCTTLDSLEEHVMKPVNLRLRTLSDNILSGEVTFREIETLFGELYHDRYDIMRDEITQICRDGDCVDKRIDQLKKFRSYLTMNDVARVMVDLKETYDMKGNFGPFESMQSHKNEDLAFKDFEESLSEVGDLLEGITQERIISLQAFIQSHQLVKWLNDSMKEFGLKEFIVFVDLATISAGESTEKMAMVKSLHAGVNAYSPLIFDLSPNDDYRDVIQKCQKVWEILEESPMINESLVFANQHLEWFKHVKNTKGVVEVTSFMEANAINDFGIFTIGKNAGTYVQNGGHEVTSNTALSRVIKLTVPADKKAGRIEAREYSLSELEELQSKLILVAGEAEKGQACVERFSMVLDGVIRLSQVYIRLVSSGCVIFTNFAIKLFCEPNLNTPVCVILEFKNGEELTQLKCRKTNDERLENIMPKIASQMEKCLEDWIAIVNANRSEYLHLNYYTMDQLVIIQKEIANLCLEKETSPKLFPLLQCVKNDCKKDDVICANQKAVKEIKEGRSDKDVEQEASHLIEKEDPRRDKFIKKLVMAKFERLIPFALEKFPNFDISKALTWCMRNKNNVKKFETERKSRLSKTRGDVTDDLATGDTQPTDTFATLMSKAMANEGQYDKCEFMLLKFDRIWKDFIQAIISNLQDFISLKQLGVLLRHLANEEKKKMNRTFPEAYIESSPNLVICSTDEVLQTTLSAYMMGESADDMPLPQSDEVLMCSAKTSLEQVDVFLRRSIFFSNGKIHCIVNADLMEFNVCEGLHDLLQEYIRKVDSDVKYRLIIICGSEKEHSLSMISSLEKYRRNPVILDPGRVKTNIQNKLRADIERGASSVDFDKSTVRLVQSQRSGVGKTLYKKRREEALKKRKNDDQYEGITLPLHQKKIDIDHFIGRLLRYTEGPDFSEPRLFHIDITNEVQEGVDFLLFNLLILGCLVHESGYIWRKSVFDLYLIETRIECKNKEHKETMKNTFTNSKHQMLNFLPSVVCRSPQESVSVYQKKKKKINGFAETDQLFDELLYKSDLYQKPYMFLRELNGQTGTTSMQDCLEILLRTCRVENPSWSELYHFVSFLHTQIIDFDKNYFVSQEAATDFPGFRTFVTKFLLQMSRDFSSRSLNMSEESGVLSRENAEEDELKEYQMKRTWESRVVEFAKIPDLQTYSGGCFFQKEKTESPHPYLFFNADHTTFTFIGFNIEAKTKNLVDIQTGEVLEEQTMEHALYNQLVRHGVPIQENFDKLSRTKKIARLCMVMGIDPPTPDNDPDITYELTTDNVKKMMAIYMRFRCNIPVIIMGETGCGKTRLVRFLCELMTCDLNKKTCKKTLNMIIVKIHGGTTNKDIISNVEKADEEAQKNADAFGDNLYTVLFFDEANTTESIGLLKEIMCDKTMEGLPLKLCKNLKLVAACNPYRRHPTHLIEKLEKAGLGYHVRANETNDRLGRIPLRRLVYRVQPLPQSLLPFVWDFGQLTTEVEELYIRQMVKRYVENHIAKSEHCINVISSVLTQSQKYMRTLKDECSFVSLRDVDRVLQIMCWFYSRPTGSFFEKADEKLKLKYGTQACENTNFHTLKLSKVTRSLVLALGVCYHACVNDRQEYRSFIAKFFRQPCALPRGADQIWEEINSCQEVFIEAVTLERDIARNLALKENVYMMVVCIELRIPLFLVGKPGSSKSLAKLIVADAMQGSSSKNDLFKDMKQVQMLSFQCSPHSTPAGISTTFRQCAEFQKNNNLDKFISVVVLDEVGLAEDSPKLPLKTLHPLLEDGCQGDEEPEPYKKVGFIGISNWALDPAKMNRGIFVQRGVPDSSELETTARGICQKTIAFPGMEKLVHELAGAYLKVFQMATETKREFFGLRDFYCLMKMINKFCDDSKGLPSFHQLQFSLTRNFSGLETFNPIDIFINETNSSVPIKFAPQKNDPDCSFRGLIKSCLSDTNSRHLLLITENYSALSTFQQQFLERKTHLKPKTIFGSSFRRDQEYTQVCRNINRIKVYMETGNTVILLNSENLYESLYEALNQYYVSFGGQKYVDLGLGTHRVKCPVHKNFKLIVVAEKQTVYEEFPIPLINRLEKHHLTSSTMLSPDQMEQAELLKDWIIEKTKFALPQENSPKDNDIGKIIIGYHDDACYAVVLNIWEELKCQDEDEHKQKVIIEAKKFLLWCATPDAIVRLCYQNATDEEFIQKTYWEEQAHESISQYLKFQICTRKEKRLLAQVTTRTRLLTYVHREALSEACDIPESQIYILESLTTFDTEQQFISKVRDFLHKTKDTQVLIVIQCDTGDENANLIACARHGAVDECSKVQAEKNRKSPVHIVVIVQVTTLSQRHFKTIQCGEWHSVHIDHLYSVSNAMPDIPQMQGKSIGKLIDEAIRKSAKVIETKTIQDKETNPALSPDTSSQSSIFSDKIKSVDLKQILPMCVQRAMSMVQDTGEGGIGITNRISLILSCLQQTDDFAIGIGRLLGLLLLEKESSSFYTKVNNWLPLKAAAVDMIQKTGTLRRACLQIFENELSPILAGLIAVLDTNKNINILGERDTWQFNLWIRMLNRTDIFDLTYQDVVRESKDTEQVDFVVFGTGFEGYIFQSKMPYSWLIYKKISEILKCDSTFLGQIDGTASRAVFGDSPIMEELSTVPPENHAQAIDCYIVDFVNMIYSSREDEEMTVVCDMIKQDMTIINRDDADELPLYVALINVHYAYTTLSSKLRYFREMNHVWKECSANLLCISELPETHILQEQHCTDRLIQGVYLLIEKLSPADDASFHVFDNSSERLTWLANVHRIRYIVQQTFTFYASLKDISSEDNIVLIEARSMWNKVVVMYLFVENVCSTSSEDKITIELCDPLWTQLCEDEVDMKQVATFEKVEEFLGTCFDLAREEYEIKLQRCSHCSKILSETSKKLPCNHEVCDVCVQTQTDLSDSRELVCPSCPKRFEASYLDKPDSRFIPGKDKLEDYQRRCTIFLMNIVSQLCFAENQGPDKDVIGKLMNYIFESGIQSIGVCHDHAFKTFIFKLLLRTSQTEFRDHLEEFILSVIKPSVEQSDSEANVECPAQMQMCEKDELMMIIAYCIEDNINEHDHPRRVTLKETQEHMYNSDSLVDQFHGIAYARILLNKAAGYINLQICESSSSSDGPFSMLDEDATTFLEKVKTFCNEQKAAGARKYLLRYLYRTFGFDILRAAFQSNDTSVNWVYSDEFKTREPDRVDRFMACGSMYVRIKDYLKIPNEKPQADDVIQFVKNTNLTSLHGFIYLQMAIYWELTVSKSKRNADTVRRILVALSNTNKTFGNMAILHAMCNNDLKQFNLDIQSETTEKDINIKCLVFQWISILFSVKQQPSCPLFNVLINLATHPSDFKNALLPTMEQDEMYDIIDILRAGEKDNQIVYRCQNGHPYVIRNCGKPWVVAKCPCGSKIGGTLHKLEDKNVKDDGSDKTLTGHILGLAEERKNGAAPERDLKPLNCACERLLLHLTMYAACVDENIQDVTAIIKADIDSGKTVDFLFSHIKKDICDIQSALKSSPDDVLLFCHYFVDSIVKRNEKPQIDAEFSYNHWSNKENRRQWEKEFDEKYVRPVVQDCNAIIEQSNELLKENSEIVAMLSDSNVNSDDSESEYLCTNAMFWMYRVPVTFTHMKHVFQRMSDSAQSKLSLVKRFYEEEHVLKAIRFIPSILRLQRILLRKYSRKYYKTDIKDITIGTLKQDKVAGDDTEQLLNDVTEAWSIARHVIAEQKHVCLTEYGRVFVPKELCDEPFTEDSHIEVLLPNTDDSGICSFAMLEILMKMQNEFLEEYRQVCQRKGAEVHMSAVCPKEITSAHLISFDLLQDIQPLVLANCSFNVRNSNIDYDFDNFEKQLIDRFVSTKSVIQITPMQIDEMIYRADISVSDYMMMLEKHIHQKPLTPVMRNQISCDVRDIPDICQILSHLDITIRVLSVTDADPESMLYNYMIDKLKMNRGVLTTKIRQLCKLNHVQSLWMTLSIQKAVIMLTHGKATDDIFDTIQDPYHERLPAEHVEQFRAFLKRQSNERQYALLDVLFEYITLRVARKQNEEDEDYQDQSAYPIKYCVYEYASEIGREEELEFVKHKGDGYDFPDGILRKHCLFAWAFVAENITKSKTV